MTALEAAGVVAFVALVVAAFVGHRLRLRIVAGALDRAPRALGWRGVPLPAA